MIRSRRLFGLVILLLGAIVTISFLRAENQFPSPILSGHYNHNEHEHIQTSVPPATSDSHPVHKLVSQAEKDFKTLLARQSKTLEDAVIEYRRRYQMPPPPNFDKWFAYAQSKQVQLIDEFDSIYNTMLPFWAVEPAVLRERIRQTIGFNNAMIAVLIRNGKVAKTEGGGDMYKWHREATPVMLKKFIEYLPDMDLAFNIHDEPRIVMQHDDLQRHIHFAKTQNIPRAFSNERLKNSFSSPPEELGKGDRIKEYRTTRFNVFAHQPTWSNSRMSCPPESAVRACFNDSCPDNTAAYTRLPLGFIQNTTSFSDICNSPSFETSFGFFDRPNAFDVAHELIPVFSQSKVSSFQDILYPSPWYYMGKVKLNKRRDMSWSEKKPAMFWRGSTTGGFSRDGSWRRQHRQKFMQKIQPAGITKTLSYDNTTDPSHPVWVEKETNMKDVSHFFDVKFTSIGQCDPGDCDAQKEYFEVVKHVNMMDALGYRYLLDIDGNAFSGRYYAWLQSNSLVYKLALFREWHDEWLMPWAHYIPLTLKGDEYVESIRYFDQEELGQLQAQKIAEQSQDWAQKVLRNEDMEVWFFRLLLEYGRVVDDDRYNIGFSI